MVIKVLELMTQCYSYEDGTILKDALLKRIKRGERSVVDFSGVNGVPSSFVNGSFVALLDDVTFDDIKKYVTFLGTNTQITGLIRERLQKTSMSQ